MTVAVTYTTHRTHYHLPATSPRSPPSTALAIPRDFVATTRVRFTCCHAAPVYGCPRTLHFPHMRTLLPHAVGCSLRTAHTPRVCGCYLRVSHILVCGLSAPYLTSHVLIAACGLPPAFSFRLVSHCLYTAFLPLVHTCRSVYRTHRTARIAVLFAVHHCCRVRLFALRLQVPFYLLPLDLTCRALPAVTCFRTCHRSPPGFPTTVRRACRSPGPRTPGIRSWIPLRGYVLPPRLLPFAHLTVTTYADSTLPHYHTAPLPTATYGHTRYHGFSSPRIPFAHTTCRCRLGSYLHAFPATAVTVTVLTPPRLRLRSHCLRSYSLFATTRLHWVPEVDCTTLLFYTPLLHATHRFSVSYVYTVTCPLPRTCRTTVHRLFTTATPGCGRSIWLICCRFTCLRFSCLLLFTYTIPGYVVTIVVLLLFPTLLFPTTTLCYNSGGYRCWLTILFLICSSRNYRCSTLPLLPVLLVN